MMLLRILLHETARIAAAAKPLVAAKIAALLVARSEAAPTAASAKKPPLRASLLRTLLRKEMREIVFGSWDEACRCKLFHLVPALARELQ